MRASDGRSCGRESESRDGGRAEAAEDRLQAPESITGNDAACTAKGWPARQRPAVAIDA